MTRDDAMALFLVGMVVIGLLAVVQVYLLEDIRNMLREGRSSDKREGSDAH